MSAHSLLTPRLLTHLCLIRQLNLSNNRLCGVYYEHGTHHGNYNAEGINAIADALRANGGLTVANLLGNQLDAESAKMLAEVAKQKGVSLCGIQRDQTTADLSGHALKPPDAILLASDLSQAVVTGGLTALDLSSNDLMDEGVSAVCEAIQSNKETKLASLDFEYNGISPGGANAVAAMVAVTPGALTKIREFHVRFSRFVCVSLKLHDHKGMNGRCTVCEC